MGTQETEQKVKYSGERREKKQKKKDQELIGDDMGLLVVGLRLQEERMWR
uniref:Uncharacterized protein n=1 Tax=Cucumis melo TaxID=3656 RepID=A0A9I9EI95_CUCME